MMEALNRQPDPLVLETMRRVLEFERRPHYLAVSSKRARGATSD